MGAEWLVNVAIAAAWRVFAFPLQLLRWLIVSPGESYSSLDHLALNVKRPETEWLNMGNWSSTDEFPQACEDLARLLYREAGLKENAAILDVGHGSGDSLLLLARELRPRLLHGVTSLPSHARRADSRLKKQQRQLKKDVQTQANIFCKDAIRFLEEKAEPTYDFILALDCAYHFQTRRKFLELCYRRLRPGGKVALLDLAASHPSPKIEETADFYAPSPSLPRPSFDRPLLLSRAKHRLVTFLSGVPIVNLVSIDRYHADLRQCNFVNISIKDTSHLVFPGFARFLQSYGKGEDTMWRGGGFLQAKALNSFGSVVEQWSRGGDAGMVRSIVVVAQKADH